MTSSSGFLRLYYQGPPGLPWLFFFVLLASYVAGFYAGRIGIWSCGFVERENLREKTRTKNKLNPHMATGRKRTRVGIKLGPHWWEANALNTAPSSLPPFRFLLDDTVLTPLELRALPPQWETPLHDFPNTPFPYVVLS